MVSSFKPAHRVERFWPHVRSPITIDTHHTPCHFSDVALYAKKKTKTLVSSDILSSLDEDESDITLVEEAESMSDSKGTKKKKKVKKQKSLISEDLMYSLENEENTADSMMGEDKDTKDDETDFTKSQDLEQGTDSEIIAASIESPSDTKKKKKKKKKKKDFDWTLDAVEGNPAEDDLADEDSQESSSNTDILTDMAALPKIFDLEIEEVEKSQHDADDEDGGVDVVEGPSLEEKVRKEKPPARVRFAESSQPNFISMGLDKIELMFGNTVVLKDASFGVESGQRVGLVGPNGGGKTTILRILAEVLEPTAGDIIKSSKALRVAFLRQEFTDELVETRSLRDELYSAFSEEQELLKKIAACEEEIAKTVGDSKKMEEALNTLQKYQDEAISKGVYALDGKVDKVMDQMGFSTGDANLPVSSFSGGWKMRIGIAKILLLSPSILLLDEPTNHLDLDSVFWLEDFLRSQSIPMVIVSHDREFLDKVCNKIVDVEDGRTVSYDGNYSTFLIERRRRLATWRDQYEKQNKFVKEEEKWIKKNSNNEQMSQQVKNREMALKKLKGGDEWIEMPPKDRKFRFRFPPTPRCGESVIESQGLGHGYGTGKHQTLFKDVNFSVQKGNRIGFVGPNGSGKSTLMRIIMGGEEPREGWSEFGSANVVSQYFQQNQADALDLDETVVEAVKKDAPLDFGLTEIRALLGQFMFKGDDVNKKIRVLSGGEKARVALCKMMLTPANLLCLDEPTNHLDITAKEVLEDAIQNFEGSIMVISHDRYFMSQVANTIFHFDDKGLMRHDCDYHDFMEKMGSLKERVESRYVPGDRFQITNAKEVVIKEVKSKKNFGGSGTSSGRLNKGIKNAKRYAQ